MAHDVNQSEKDVAAQVRSALVERISAERYELWISNSTDWQFTDGVLTLNFDSDFSSQLAKRMLSRELTELACQISGELCEVVFRVGNVANTRPTIIEAGSSERQDSRGNLSASLETQVRSTSLADGTALHSRPERGEPVESANLTFQSASTLTTTASQALSAIVPQGGELWQQYVCGTSNQLAWATAKLVLSEPGRLSPVFLFGPSGSGKTLLATAVAQQLRVTRRLRRVVHMTSEQFTNDFTEGLRGGGLPMFRRKYRDVDALILEDIQFFIGKKSTLAEVKHTLDNLLRLGKQVVFTADRSLNELQQLGSEIVGRIRGGLTSPVFPLDEKTRFEILARDIRAAGIQMDESVVRQIAARAAGDGRVLSGIAKRLTAVAALESPKIEWERCWSAIYDLVQSTQPIVRIADIERVVCNVFGLEADSLQTSSKVRSVSQPRMLAMFLARKYTPAAYKEIGQHFGKRKHSTVISAEKTVEGWLVDESAIALGRGLSVRDAIRHVESQLQVG